MQPWVLLDRSLIPGEPQELRLLRRADEFSIRLGNTELMNSRLFGSEETLAQLTATRIRERNTPQVLIGGLGMGFTLRAALAVHGPGARVTVVELVPAVLAWARGPLGGLFGASLSDPRLTVAEGDVRTFISAGEEIYDAILLDVDNGPEGLTRSSNNGLYGARGLEKAHRALRPGGALGVWSAGTDLAFARKLAQTGFAVEELRVRARAKSQGGHHVIWLATKA
jgi:spermidine synthase